MSDTHYWDPARDTNSSGWLTQCGEYISRLQENPTNTVLLWLNDPPVTCTACILLKFEAAANGEPFYIDKWNGELRVESESPK